MMLFMFGLDIRINLQKHEIVIFFPGTEQLHALQHSWQRNTAQR